MSRSVRLGVLAVFAVVLVVGSIVVLLASDEPGPRPSTRPPMTSGSPPVSSSPSPSPTPSQTPSPPPPPPTLTPCPPGPTRTLTVLTFNIHGALGHGGYDLDRVADEIEEWDADVVLLQEVDRHRERTELDDQALLLSTRLEMFAAYGANVVRPPALPDLLDAEYGTLTLSRFPITDTENFRLPNRPGLEQRGLLRTTLDLGGAPVDIYNTHLQHTSGAVRRDQVRAIKQELRIRSLPTVVGGDLNAEPDSRALNLLTRWRLRDPWPAVGVDEGLTVPAGEPRRRIDFVLHDTAFVPVAADDLRSEVSDHRAVRVRLELPAPADCSAAPTGAAPGVSEGVS